MPLAKKVPGGIFKTPAWFGICMHTRGPFLGKVPFVKKVFRRHSHDPAMVWVRATICSCIDRGLGLGTAPFLKKVVAGIFKTLAWFGIPSIVNPQGATSVVSLLFAGVPLSKKAPH